MAKANPLKLNHDKKQEIIFIFDNTPEDGTIVKYDEGVGEITVVWVDRSETRKDTIPYKDVVALFDMSVKRKRFMNYVGNFIMNPLLDKEYQKMGEDYDPDQGE